MTFNNVAVTTVNSWSATQISVSVPSGSTTGGVVVKIGDQSSSGVTFTLDGVVSNITSIQASNLTSTSATITFITDGNAVANIDYGTTTSLGSQVTESSGARRLHAVDITGLNADTTYYYDVYAGGITQNNGGSYYSFHTTKVGNGSPYTIFGQVLAVDNSTAADGVLVHLSVTDSSDLTSQTLSALTNSNGYWFLDLGNLKDMAAANHVFSYTTGDEIGILIDGGAVNGVGNATKAIGTSPQNAEIITLQVDITQTVSLLPGLNLITLPLTPTSTQTAYGLISGITGAKEIFSWGGSSWGSSAFDASGTTSGTDFNLALGKGYMLNVGVTGNWSVTGSPLSTATDISLVTGLNLVGVPHPAGLTARSTLPVISGGQIITQWDATTQSWKSVFDIGDGTILGDDFNFSTKEGYFLQVSQDSTWTPAVVSTAPQVRLAEPKIVPALATVSQIQDLMVANLTSTSVTVAFRTDGVGRSQLRWRLEQNKLWQTVDSDHLVSIGQTHNLQLSGLQPEQTYLVQAEVADRDGQIKHSQVMTLTTTAVATGQPKVVYGQVIDLNGHPKADELVVLTATEAQPLLAKTDSKGYWQLNLGNMKTLTGDPDTAEGEVHLSVLGEDIIHRQMIEDLPIQQLTTIRYHQDVTGQVTTALGPQQSDVGQNYPNPFNPETWIPYQLHQEGQVQLEIYASDGRMIRQIDLGMQPVGYHTTKDRAIYWDGRNQRGEWVTSGVYFYRLSTGSIDKVRKMLVLK